MKNSLKKLKKCLKKHNPDVLQYLNKGIKEKNIVEDLSKIYGVSVNASLINEILQWHNGIDPDYKSPARKFHIIPMFSLLSLHGIKSLTYSYFDECTESSIVPCFFSGHGEIIGTPFKASKSIMDLNKLYFLYTGDPETSDWVSIYDSFECLVETTIKAFEKKIVFIDKDGLLDFDFDKHYDLAKKMNPNSDYW